MKTPIIALIALGFVYQTFGQGAQGAMITERARKLASENNARQGVPQQSQPAAPPLAQPQKAVAPGPAQIQQQNINKIKNDIAAILTGAEVSKEKISKLATDVASAAHGAKKPSLDTVSKLANGVATNLVGKALGSAEQLRLAQDLEAIVNSSSFSKLQTDAYVSDVQTILQKAGIKPDDAAGITVDVKAVALEIQH